MMNLMLILLMSSPSVEWTALPNYSIWDVECAGDLNGDGTDDLFVSGTEGGFGVHCLNGLTGEVIWVNDEGVGVYSTGSMRTIDDIDSDGHCDLALGSSSPPTVTTLSGLTGNTIWSFPQTYEVHWVEAARGSSPGEVAILVSSDFGAGENHLFYALNGQTGDPIWSSNLISTLDEWIRVTESDVSGNGWSEMGYHVDRSSVMTGGASVRDSYTGQVISSHGTYYFGTMDLCDDPYSCLAVSSFGSDPVMLVKSITTGSIIWQSDDDELFFQNLDYLQNFTGEYLPYKEIAGWKYSTLMLIRGDDGFHGDTYMFPYSIVSVDCFLDEDEEWRIAVLTTSSFHCPVPAFSSPSVEPSIQLPDGNGRDMCLLESDAYATPLIGVAMGGEYGVCVLSTSAPVAVSYESDPSINQTVQVQLLSNPSHSGITLYGIGNQDLSVTDISGRVLERVSISEGQLIFRHLPAGVYLVLDSNTGMLLLKAVVI